jgi:lipopolysaccharide transport system permease protein
MSILEDKLTPGVGAKTAASLDAGPLPVTASAPVPPDMRITVIRPRRGWRSLDLREVWAYRDLLVTLGMRDIKVRYKQTALGALWVVLQPLISAGIFSVVFGALAGIKTGKPYMVFTFAGALAWGVFAGLFSKIANSMVANAHLVSKIYFPRLLLPFSGAFSTLLDFTVSLGVMAVLMAAFRVAPHAGLLLMPVFLLLLVLLSVGVGLMAAAAGVKYRDIIAITPFLLQVLQYGSAIQYPLSLVREKLAPPLRLLFFANPLVPLIDGFRWSLIGGEAPMWGLVGVAAAVSVALFVVGLFQFKRAEREFADVI